MIPFNPFSGLMAKIYGTIALVAIAVAGVQTVRIEGVWFIKGYEERLANSEAREGQLIDASEAAKQAAIANAARVKAEYERIKANAKITYNRALADNRATIDRWMQNNRGATGQSNSAAATEIPTGIARAETLPELPSGFVLLPATDLPIMADIQATLYALQQAAREVERVQTVPE